MNVLARQGWTVEGIEFSPAAADEARRLGHRVWTGALESSPDPEKPFDLAIGWMVLEHLHEPRRGLELLHRRVRPGGWLAISVPDASALEFHLFRDAWYALHLPNHLYHFTPSTLARLLAIAGWRLRRVFRQRNLGNLVASLGYVLADRGIAPSIAGRMIAFPDDPGRGNALLYPAALAAAALGQTGRMTLWATRE